MQEIRPLISKINRIRLRLIGLRLAHASAALLCVGLALWALLHALGGYIDLPALNLYVTAGIAGGLGLTYLLTATFSGLGAQRLAQRIDHESNNFDRAGSALSFAEQAQQTPLMRLAIRDAADRAVALRLNWRAIVRGRALAAKLVLAVFCSGMLFASLSTDWEALRNLPGSGDQALIPVPDSATLPSEQGAEIPEQIIPQEFMAPTLGLIENWRAEIRRRRERDQQQKPDEQSEETETPETIYGSAQGIVPDGVRETATVQRPNAAVVAGDLSRLVDPTLDGNYASAFAELDRWVFTDEPINTEDLREVSEMLDEGGQGYEDTGTELINTVGRGRTKGDQDLDLNGREEMEVALKSAQQQSFGEFLQDYAGHLERVADNAENVPLDEMATGEMMMTSLPPPEDAELSMVPTDNPGDMQLAMGQPMEGQMPTSSEAGTGAGTPTGTFKPERVQAGSSDLLEIESHVGEGKSPLQIIEDFSDAHLNGLQDLAYTALFQRYAQDAQQELSVEALPVALKVYVRDYFLLIQPQPNPKP
ncbi:MAG: hypothetical protein P9M14_15755 [Candidatus Alcyoniella australis]|nr:hypothetical protein [Candidatus Alcyoniella australis]